MNLESTSEARTSKFTSTGQPFIVSLRRAASSSFTCPHGLFISSQRARSRGRKPLRSFAGFCISRRELGLGSYCLRRNFLAASRRGSHETAPDVPRRGRRRGRVGTASPSCRASIERLRAAPPSAYAGGGDRSVTTKCLSNTLRVSGCDQPPI